MISLQKENACLKNQAYENDLLLVSIKKNNSVLEEKMKKQNDEMRLKMELME